MVIGSPSGSVATAGEVALAAGQVIFQARQLLSTGSTWQQAPSLHDLGTSTLPTVCWGARLVTVSCAGARVACQGSETPASKTCTPARWLTMGTPAYGTEHSTTTEPAATAWPTHCGSRAATGSSGSPSSSANFERVAVARYREPARSKP